MWNFRFKKIYLFIVSALLLICCPSAVSADSRSFMVGVDANSDIVSALASASDADIVTLTGSGTVMLEEGANVHAAVIISPDAGEIIVSGGDFKGPVAAGADPTEQVIFRNSSLHELSISGPVALEGSTVSSGSGSPVQIAGGSLSLSDGAVIEMTGDSVLAPSVAVNGNASAISIGVGCRVSSMYKGIHVAGSGISVGTISVSGVLQGSYRALSLNPGAAVSRLEVNSNAQVFANGGAGVAVENAGGTIVQMEVAKNAKIEGSTGGVVSMMDGAIGNILIFGKLSGTPGGSGISNTDSLIDSIFVSGGAITGATAGISNIYGSEATTIGSIVMDGGQIWGKGKSGDNGMGVVNMGAEIFSIEVKSGSYLEGGTSGEYQGYGIFNCYRSQSARIGSLAISGNVAGMDGKTPLGTDQGGIGVYNRASLIDTLMIESMGTVHGELAGICNNYDQTVAEIKNFVNKGRVMSGTNSLVNSPAGDGSRAALGSEVFDVENGGARSLLRGASDLGQIGGIAIDEIVPVVRSSFSSDFKNLMVTCLDDSPVPVPISGLGVQLFCLDDSSFEQTSVTDEKGQVIFTFTQPFDPQGKTFWFYTFAHRYLSGNKLYTSAKADLPNIPQKPSGTGFSGSAGTLQTVKLDADGSFLDVGIIDPLKPCYVIEIAPKDGSAYVTVPLNLIKDWNKKNKNFILEIKTGFGSYRLPSDFASKALDLSELLRKNGLEEENASVRVTLIEKTGGPAAEILKKNFPLGQRIGSLVEFKVEILDLAQNGGVIGKITRFSEAVSRRIAVPAGAAAGGQYGAFRFDEESQRFEFIPHRLLSDGDTQYVEISSKSNSVYAVVRNEINFSDVPAGYWGRESIAKAAAKGLVNGMGGGLYQPQKDITRAEFIKMVINAVSSGSGSTSFGKDIKVGMSYSDVKAGDWFYDSIRQAKERKLLTFADNANFRPNQAITREEMASVLAAVLREENYESSTGDVDLSTVFHDYSEENLTYTADVALSYRAGLMKGNGNGSFNFFGSSTRAEAAAVQIRLLEALGMIDR